MIIITFFLFVLTFLNVFSVYKHIYAIDKMNACIHRLETHVYTDEESEESTEDEEEEEKEEEEEEESKEEQEEEESKEEEEEEEEEEKEEEEKLNKETRG